MDFGIGSFRASVWLSSTSSFGCNLRQSSYLRVCGAACVVFYFNICGNIYEDMMRIFENESHPLNIPINVLAFGRFFWILLGYFICLELIIICMKLAHKEEGGNLLCINSTRLEVNDEACENPIMPI